MIAFVLSSFWQKALKRTNNDIHVEIDVVDKLFITMP